MNAGFSVSMTPRRILKCFTRKFNFPKVVSIIETMAAGCGCSVNRTDEQIAVNFCPQGDLFIQADEEQQTVCASANSSIAGPGFHAAAIDFCNALAKTAGLAAVYQEEDPYSKSGDFEGLRNEVFLPFLKELLDAVEAHGRESSEAICFAWPDEWFLLADAPENCWYCPTGLYPCSVKSLFEQDPMAFLLDFFIWPNQARDARYRRNLAMSHAWTLCSFQAADPMCKKICKELEAVATEDPQLPFPKKLYLELCGITGRTPIGLDGMAEDSRFESVGFRKFPLLAPVGNWEFLIPGGFRRETLEDGVIRLADPDHCIKATSSACMVAPEEEEEFRAKMLGAPMRQHPDKVFLEEVPAGAECHVELFRVSDDWPHLFLLECRKIKPGGQMLTIMFNFETRGDYQWGLDILKTARCREALE